VHIAIRGEKRTSGPRDCHLAAIRFHQDKTNLYRLGISQSVIPAPSRHDEVYSYSTMILSALLAASAIVATISAAPVETQGSKHVVYLSSCAPDDCPIGLCDPEDFNIVGAGYFRNGPPASNSASATALGRLSSVSSGQKWEGSKITTRIGSEGAFTSNIARGAKSLAKGSIAGDGELKPTGLSEPFVCFRDGATKFKASYDGDRYTCTADYYCPSIDVKTAEQ
jgi:hypothetical protein